MYFYSTYDFRTIGGCRMNRYSNRIPLHFPDKNILFQTMKRLLWLAANPIVLSGIMAVVLAFLLVPEVTRYSLRFQNQMSGNNGMIRYFDDLDGNGYSDELVFSGYPNHRSCVTIHFEPDIDLKEVSYPGDYSFGFDSFFSTGDYNKDGVNEMCVFTISQDSLMLHIISGLRENKPDLESRFICVTSKGKANTGTHLKIVKGGWEDLNGDGFREFIFATNFGETPLPRNVYAYDIRNDSLMVSEKNGYHIIHLLLEDINNDGTKEIIINGYASQNLEDTIAWPVHDLYCRLIVLGKDLRYLFSPVIFPLKGYSSLSTTVFTSRNGAKRLLSLYCPPLKYKRPATLMIHSSDGSLLKKENVSYIKFEQAFEPVLINKGTTPYFGVPTNEPGLFVFDTNLTLVRKTREANLMLQVYHADLDEDGEDEIIAADFGKDRLGVCRKDLSDPVWIDLGMEGESRSVFSLCREPGRPPFLAFDSGSVSYIFSYAPNPYYYLRWLLVTGIFLAVFLFARLVGRFQRLRIEDRLKTEKKITELQLAIVRNQINPHFTMNAINSVIMAIEHEKKEEARASLEHFSRLYRSMLLSSDTIKRSLAEELDFTRSYLALEKFRFGDAFTFEIEVAPAVDMQAEVPKMVVQAYVENAVKHAMGRRRSGGRIAIAIRQVQPLSAKRSPAGRMEITIEDNGPGLEADGIGPAESTGKGMKVMAQFYELWQKVTGIPVTAVAEPVADETGMPAGMRVVVQIGD